MTKIIKKRASAALVFVLCTALLFIHGVAAIPNYSPGNYIDVGQLDAGTNPVLGENSGIDSSARNPGVIASMK